MLLVQVKNVILRQWKGDIRHAGIHTGQDNDNLHTQVLKEPHTAPWILANHKLNLGLTKKIFLDIFKT